MERAMKRLTRYIPMTLALTLLLGGCALSPQQVLVQPKVQVPSSNQGHNLPVKVIAVDARGKQAFGSRGGVYSDTATIGPSNDVRQAIADSVRQGLQSLGFNAYNPGDNATSLEVRLKKLDYVPNDSAMLHKVTVSLELDAIAKRGDTTHTATYKTSVNHKSPFPPSQADNQKMINDILSQGIQDMLQDPKMIAFLAGNDNP